MEEWIKTHGVQIAITIVTTLVVFSSSFGGIKTEVSADSEKLKNTVTRDELRLVLDGQKQMNDQLNARLGRIENKIDALK